MAPGMSFLVAILLLLVASAIAFEDRCKISGSNCPLGPDINRWSHAPGLNRSHTTRFWNRSILNVAISGSAAQRSHPFHVRNFFDKLASGKRIVSVALGSSLVHDFAGCWQPSFKQLWEEGCIPSESCKCMQPILPASSSTWGSLLRAIWHSMQVHAALHALRGDVY